MRWIGRAVLGFLVATALPAGAMAQQTVKIGAIYPLSGNAASAGNYSKAAIELASTSSTTRIPT